MKMVVTLGSIVAFSTWAEIVILHYASLHNITVIQWSKKETEKKGRTGKTFVAPQMSFLQRDKKVF